MPPQVYEERLHLSCSILEPVPLTLESASAFPFVPLRATGAFESKEFRVYVLENEFLRAEIAPELGGRLISLHDKRDQSNPIARPQRLEVSEAGRRGVDWPHGLEITTPGRLNALGPLDAFPREPDDEEQPAAVFLFDRQGPVSWHACWSLLPGRAELSLEIRAFNRSLLPVDFHADLKGEAAVRILIEAPSQTLLLPRRTAVFTFRILPAAGFGPSTIWGRAGLADVDAGTLRLRPAQRASSAGIRIIGRDQTVEARVDLNPEVDLTADLPDIGPLEALEIDGQRLDRPHPKTARASALEDAWRTPRPDTLESDLLSAAQALQNDPLAHPDLAPEPVPGGEHLALLLLAFRASRAGDFREADELLDQYIGLNAEDALAWWLKSILALRIRSDAPDSPEAMNAHFLAPLEPSLRVQSFLAQGPAQGRDPNPLMRPLAADPDAAVDAVHHLLLAGLFEEAHRVLDELLRHRPSARLHILAAWLFHRKSRMAFESAHHAQTAAAIPPEPPFPHFSFEYQALADLVPATPALASYQALETYSPSRAS